MFSWKKRLNSRRYSRRMAKAALLKVCVWMSVIPVFSPPGISHAQEDSFLLSEPLLLSEVIQVARTHRSEIVAARANAAAARERETVASALEDPMLIPAIGHYPFRAMNSMDQEFSGGRFDWSLTVQQRFPLSRVRTHLRSGAEAETRRLSAEVDRVVLDMELDAIEAFFMLQERRRMLAIVAGQIELAEQMVAATNARYAAARGPQFDVLRAEVEVNRLYGMSRSLAAEVQGLEAMFNTSLGRAVNAAVPALVNPVQDELPPAVAVILEDALSNRPELEAGAAEIASYTAEVAVMKSMYRPMAMVQVGPASSMVAGNGGMVMIGISMPIWREKLRAGVAEAQAMEHMARADLVAMRRMIESEVLSAREAVVAAREKYVALRDEVVPRTNRMIDPVLASYAEGTSILATVIDVAQAQWTAEAELVMAETDLGVAWAQLSRARGRFLEGQP